MDLFQLLKASTLRFMLTFGSFFFILRRYNDICVNSTLYSSLSCLLNRRHLTRGVIWCRCKAACGQNYGPASSSAPAFIKGPLGIQVFGRLSRHYCTSFLQLWFSSVEYQPGHIFPTYMSPAKTNLRHCAGWEWLIQPGPQTFGCKPKQTCQNDFCTHWF